MERKKRRLVGKFGGDRKSDQDLESVLVFLMSKRERSNLCVSSACDGSNPKQWLNPLLTQRPAHAAIKQH